MDITQIPGNDSHLMVFGENFFGYIPQVRAQHYVVHVDSSGTSHKKARHAKLPYATGWAVYGFNSDDHKATTVVECIGAGVLGRWADGFEQSHQFEERGLRSVTAMLAPILPGVEDGSASLTIKCDNDLSVRTLQTQNLSSKCKNPTGISDKAVVNFRWEKGHSGLSSGNTIADHIARGFRHTMHQYGSLSPIHSREIVHERLSRSAGGINMLSIFEELDEVSNILFREERAQAVAITRYGKKEWEWFCSSGFGATLNREKKDRVWALHRIGKTVRQSSIGGGRIYLFESGISDFGSGSYLFSHAFRYNDVVILRHTKPWKSLLAIPDVVKNASATPAHYPEAMALAA